MRNVSFFGILDSPISKILTIVNTKENNNYYKHTIYKHMPFYNFFKAYSQVLGGFSCEIILLSSFYGEKADYHSRKSMRFVIHQARIFMSDLLLANWMNLGEAFDLSETSFLHIWNRIVM